MYILKFVFGCIKYFLSFMLKYWCLLNLMNNLGLMIWFNERERLNNFYLFEGDDFVCWVVGGRC